MALSFSSPTPYPIAAGRYSSDIEWVGWRGEDNHSNLVMKLRTRGSEPPLLTFALTAWHLIKHRDYLTVLTCM